MHENHSPSRKTQDWQQQGFPPRPDQTRAERWFKPGRMSPVQQAPFKDTVMFGEVHSQPGCPLRDLTERELGNPHPSLPPSSSLWSPACWLLLAEPRWKPGSLDACWCNRYCSARWREKDGGTIKDHLAHSGNKWGNKKQQVLILAPYLKLSRWLCTGPTWYSSCWFKRF